MKFLIASDIHGSAYWCQKMMDLIEKENPDKIILLGDILYHGPRNDLPREYAPKAVIQQLSKIQDKIICVRGNCDAEVDQMVLPFPCMNEYTQLFADNRTFYCTHGHHENPDSLPKLSNDDIFLSGHTHIKCDNIIDGVRCLNPGSVSIPKDGTNSCLIYENGVFTFCVLEDM